MYKVWHSDVRPPIILDTYQEVRMYQRLVEALNKYPPRWKKIL